MQPSAGDGFARGAVAPCDLTAPDIRCSLPLAELLVLGVSKTGAQHMDVSGVIQLPPCQATQKPFTPWVVFSVCRP